MENYAGGKAISPLIAVSLSTYTYESSQNDLMIHTGQIVLNSRQCYLKHFKMVLGSGCPTTCVFNANVNVLFT